MTKLQTLLLGYCAVLLSGPGTVPADEADNPVLENPMSVQYLKENLRAAHPRLVFTPALVASVREDIHTDPVLSNLYAAIRLNAVMINQQPLLTRTLVGRRLLGTSREMLYRMNMLGCVYLIEEDEKVLRRINDEMAAVCTFSDWNPSHFLDVAEMSMAVALALDWTGGSLPGSTIEMAMTALVEKAIRPSWPTDGKPWRTAYGDNNWNQVCAGGLIAASIAVAEREPELAAKTIWRALDGLPHALRAYGPDGVYPEGSTYWNYATLFSVVTAAMLESAFGDDFGHLEFPGLKQSAVFRLLCNAPSGSYYNYADCGDRRDENGDLALAWFAAKSGNKAYYERDRFLRPPHQMGKLGRFAGAAMAWLSQYVEKGEERPPTAWKGDGTNPIVIFTGTNDDPHRYYFGGKGGKATTSHGNMDAGSFVFELNGVRWVIDPGNQGYYDLEKTGFDLWGRSQDSQRWTLLTKNNFGHSTVTVNKELFVNDGFAPLLDFKAGDSPEATFDLTAVYGVNIKSARRKFHRDSPISLVIEDHLEISDTTELITWQLMTTAEVEVIPGGALLTQEGQTLRLENLSHPASVVSVVSLDPPPLALDRQIEGLKRLELRIPARRASDGYIDIKVRLTPPEMK